MLTCSLKYEQKLPSVRFAALLSSFAAACIYVIHWRGLKIDCSPEFHSQNKEQKVDLNLFEGLYSFSFCVY
jgi:hypothetical protein